MVVKTQTCTFSHLKIYPGHGMYYVRSDSKVGPPLWPPPHSSSWPRCKRFAVFRLAPAAALTRTA